MFSLSQQKKCSGCGEIKPLIEFTKSKKSKSGVTALCKSCENKRVRKYWSGHPEKEKEKSLRWIRANIEKVRAKGRRWYAAHFEEENKKAREYRVNHLEQAREYSRKWSEVNKESRDESYRKYHASHPEKLRQHSRNRRARVEGNGGRITAQEWEDLKKKYNYTCLRCKRSEPEIILTQDHVIPLVLGGKHAIENVQPLCASCNCRKHTKHIDYR